MTTVYMHVTDNRDQTKRKEEMERSTVVLIFLLINLKNLLAPNKNKANLALVLLLLLIEHSQAAREESAAVHLFSVS